NSVAGNSFMLSAYGSNFGSMFIILKSFAERRGPGLYADGIMAAVRKEVVKKIPEARLNIFPPPGGLGVGRDVGFHASGLGRGARGVKLRVEDRGDAGLKELQDQTDNLVEKGNDSGDEPDATGRKHKKVQGLFTVYNANSPQLFADVDREKCLKAGVSLGDVFS